MSIHRIALFAGLFALALGGATPHSQSDVAVAPAVEQRVAAGETVRVVVGVDARFVPEGDLQGAAAVAAQRAGVQAVVADVTSRARAAGVRVEPPYETIPFFPARVDRAALDRLKTMPGVTSIEEVLIAEPTIGYSVPLTNTPAAWNAGYTGNGWTVAVLDSGVDYTHSMLQGALVSEGCFSSDGVSLCPGGVPQSFGPGSGRECNASLDGCDHGTHVSSIALGLPGTLGVPGVAPGAWLIAMQVFNYQQSVAGIRTSTIDYTRALERVFTLAGANNVNRIASVNMSLGGGQFSSQAQCDAASPSTKAAVDNLRSIGIATVVASGNNGFTNSMGFPGCLSSVISVGNTSRTAPITVTNSSNEAPFLSLLAPGTNIYAASFFGFYTEKTGTSMAAPHVAGAWAILKQAVPNASVSSVLAALRGTGTPITDTRTGRVYPFINVNAARIALASGAYSTPGTPTAFAASASGNTVSLRWNPPAGGSGGAPTGYTVLVRGGAGGPVVQTVPVGNVTAISAPVPNGIYHLSVQATNAIGAGNETSGITLSVPAAVVPPGAPTGLGASVSGSNVTFSWTPAAGGGAVSGYLLLAGLTPGFTSPFATLPLGPGSSFAIGGVPPGVYYVRLYAQGPGGTSGPSNEFVLNVAGASRPGTPTLHTPSVVGTTVSLSWTPGSGATSHSLAVSTTPGGAPIATLPVTGSSVAVPNAPRGVFFARLTALNAAGASAPSNEVTIVVP
jgi:subtilisin family serine protease